MHATPRSRARCGSRCAACGRRPSCHASWPPMSGHGVLFARYTALADEAEHAVEVLAERLDTGPHRTGRARCRLTAPARCRPSPHRWTSVTVLVADGVLDRHLVSEDARRHHQGSSRRAPSGRRRRDGPARARRVRVGGVHQRSMACQLLAGSADPAGLRARRGAPGHHPQRHRPLRAGLRDERGGDRRAGQLGTTPAAATRRAQLPADREQRRAWRANFVADWLSRLGP